MDGGSAQTFNVELREGVLVITLNRPERLNALTFEVYAELRDTFIALKQVPDARAVVITGAGRGFCAGGDREEIIAKLMERDAAGVQDFTRMTCDLVAAMRECPQPIVSAINGACVGAGAVIALASDFRYAVPEAKFGFVFVKVGLSGADMGATYLLPRVVGLTKATEWLMTGDVFDAEEALSSGFVNRLVPADELMAEAMGLATRLASGPAFALSATKSLLNKTYGASLEQALEYETVVQALCMTHPDFNEAYAAIKAKRPPRYR